MLGNHEHNGLRSVPISPPHQANAILCHHKTKHKLADYHHASLGSPAKSTLRCIICRRHLCTFPSLLTTLISKNFSPRIPTALFIKTRRLTVIGQKVSNNINTTSITLISRRLWILTPTLSVCTLIFEIATLICLSNRKISSQA